MLRVIRQIKDEAALLGAAFVPGAFEDGRIELVAPAGRVWLATGEPTLSASFETEQDIDIVWAGEQVLRQMEDGVSDRRRA